MRIRQLLLPAVIIFAQACQEDRTTAPSTSKDTPALDVTARPGNFLSQLTGTWTTRCITGTKSNYVSYRLEFDGVQNGNYTASGFHDANCTSKAYFTLSDIRLTATPSSQPNIHNVDVVYNNYRQTFYDQGTFIQEFAERPECIRRYNIGQTINFDPDCWETDTILQFDIYSLKNGVLYTGSDVNGADGKTASQRPSILDRSEVVYTKVGS